MTDQKNFTQRDVAAEKQMLLERERVIKENLPHLFGWPWYPWAWEFFNSTNRYNLIVAANQVSKSTTMIRKCTHWATATELWDGLWGRKPTTFWYVYPSLDVATVEFNEKWVKEVLPRGEQKEKGKYAWTHKMRAGKIDSIIFASGVTVYFKSYEQDDTNVQTTSVFALFLDEECPAEVYPEFNARTMSATIKGYVHAAFTATLGQEFWRLAMEEKGKAETFKTAWKKQVSLFDCMKYTDGSKSAWTEEYIQQVIDGCGSEAEVQRRVYGRFVVDEGRRFPGFSRSVNYVTGHPVPKSWLIYAGVDIGSGGISGHPGAIVFVAVNPEFTQGRIFRGWRGDKIQTTSGDILDKFVELKGKLRCVGMYYDSQARDFRTLADSRGIPFQMADKSQDSGYNLLNTLYKLGVLKIYDDDPELLKLVLEHENLKVTTGKSHAKDDFSDAARFAVTKIPWDFKAIYKVAGAPKKEKQFKTQRERDWHEMKEQRKRSGVDLLEAECDLANEAMDYGADFDDGGIF